METNQQKRSTSISKVIGVAVASLLTVVVYFTAVKTNHKGFYDNGLTSIIGNPVLEDSLANWHVRNGDNTVDEYGIDILFSSQSNYSKVANFNLKLRRLGIKDLGYVYSTSSGVTSKLDAFHKWLKVNRPNNYDSCKFSSVISEIEQYHADGNTVRPIFYAALRDVSKWCLDQKPVVSRKCYQGWPTPQDCDTIVKYTDQVYIHCYVSSSQIASGPAQYQYMNGRLTNYANSQDKLYPSNADMKVNAVPIYSVEVNQFSWIYFLTHSWDEPLPLLVKHVNLYGSPLQKKRIFFGGRQIFVSKDGRLAKP